MPLQRFHQRSLLEGAEVEIFKLLSYGATPEQWAEWLRAPLEHAAARGNFDLVQKLLKAGANGGAGWRGCRGRTLLDAAALGGSEDVVTALLQAGCVPDVRVVSVSSRRSALHVSLVCGHEAAARRLILAGADVNFRDPTDMCYPLHVAVSGGHKDLVRDLLIGGGHPSSFGFRGLTPLHLAAKLGHDEIVTTLLGTPITDKDSQAGGGLSPLMWASWEGHLPTVKILLAAGAKLTLRTSSRHNAPYCSALDFAVISKRGDVITALIEHGADINAAGPDGKAPLHRAVLSRQSVSLRLLLVAGASVHSKSAHGYTPLLCAASLSSVKMMRALLLRGAKVSEVVNIKNSTALHLACASQRPRMEEAVDVLLRSGASETAVDIAGFTPADVLERLANRRRCSADEAERARVLLVRAPADRAWRRRCWLVMLRARAEKERIAQRLGSSSDGEVLDARGKGCARTVPVGTPRLHDDGGEDGGGSQKAARTDDGGGSGAGAGVGGGDAVVTARGSAAEEGAAAREAAAEEGGLRDLVATLVGLELEGVFRTIVGYL